MKIRFAIGLLVLSILFFVLAVHKGDTYARASVTTAGTMTFSSGMITGSVASTTVTPPTTPALFVGTDGVFVAVGGKWVPLPGSGGVTSVQACNAAGTSCATAQTGAVVLDIPKTATLQ